MRVCIFVSLYTKTYQTIGFAGKYPLPAVPRVEEPIRTASSLARRRERKYLIQRLKLHLHQTYKRLL